MNLLLSKKGGIKLLGWALFAIVVSSAFVELRLVLANGRWVDIQAAVPDEALFIEIAKNGFAHYGLLYGPLFWGPLELLLWLSPDCWEGGVARACYEGAKYATIGVLARWLWTGQDQKLAATAFVLAIIASPGFMFLGKIISPEYELLLWSGLSVKSLVDDRGQLGRKYLLAVFLAAIATLTKLNGLTLLGIVIVYGIVRSCFCGYKNASTPLFRLVSKVLVLLSVLAACLSVLTWPTNLFADIRLAYTLLVPPLSIDTESIALAWSFDGVTWDQVKLGGIQRDFLPAFTLGALATLLIIPLGFKGKQSATWAIYLAALAAMLSAVFHHMGHTWYLFLPMFLFAVSGALVIANYDITVQALAVVVVLLASVASLPRLDDRLAYKRDSNRAMLAKEDDAAKFVQQALQQFPCIASANFAVMIPWVGHQKNFIPMRTALANKSSGNYVLPDLLVLNTKLPSDMASPLKQLIIKNEIDLYQTLGYTDHVSVYVLSSLTCSSARTESN